MPRLLDGIRVLDLADERGALCGRILADLGADVIRIEPPGGDALRHAGPFLGHRPDPERSLRWLAYQAGKRGMVLDLRSTSDRAMLDRLCAGADVLIESFEAGEIVGFALEAAALRRAHPHLVVCSISPFGRSGPYSNHHAQDLTVVAMGGNAALTGDPDRAPLRCTMPTSYFHGGAEAAAGILAALWARPTLGHGQHVDVSLQECMVATIMTGASQWATHRQDRGRTGAGYLVGETVQREVWPCKDGFVSYALRGGAARAPGLAATARWMEEEGIRSAAWSERDWKSYSHNNLTAADVEALSEPLGRFFRRKTMHELFVGAVERGLMLAPVNDSREIARSPQLAARNFFVQVPDAGRGIAITLPARFVRVPGIDTDVRGPAPRLDEHGTEIRREAETAAPARTPGAVVWSPAQRERAAGRSIDPRRAFDGLRVLEFGGGAAGPITTRHLADHGAHVVRVESHARPDFLRTLGFSAKNQDVDDAPFFMMLNCNKQSIALNMTDPRGVALARRLIDWCDVLAENFAPRAMRKWGLDYDSLVAVKPDLIMVSTCLMGQTGPNKDYPGFGGQGSALSGFNSLTGWPDREAVGQHGTITDSLAPRFVAAALLAALLRKQATGRGCYIDVAQVETAAYSLSSWMLEWFENGEVIGRDGNRSRLAAPHGAFPCRPTPQSAERWCTIACHTDAEWARLVEVMGEPAWATDPRLSNLAGRKQAEDALESGIAAWTRQLDAREVMERLQSAGLDSGLVETYRDLHDDPQLAHRRHFRRLPHAVIGEHLVEALGYRLSDTPEELASPGPRLGQNTEEICRDLLGLSSEEIAELTRAGVLY